MFEYWHLNPTEHITLDGAAGAGAYPVPVHVACAVANQSGKNIHACRIADWSCVVV
jgi:hypothetical protein